jgi:hypothetical protein
VLNRVLQGQDTTLRLSLITDVRILLSHTDLFVGDEEKKRK